jgi:hypothetical protein
MSIDVRTTNDTEAQADFQNIRKAVYADDRRHIPSPDPFPTDGTVFIAYDNDQPVARCCGRMQTGDTSIGTIGNFQAVENQPAANALLSSACQWLKEQGAQRIIGPMDGDTWHAYRFNTGPFTSEPFTKEPWNPPYYPALWQEAGFCVAETYDSYSVSDTVTAAANQLKFYQRCKRNGFTFLPITPHNFEELLPTIHDLSCRIFRDNILYTPITRDTFIQMYRPAIPLLKSGLSWIAFAPDKTAAGYTFAYPDYTAALRAMAGSGRCLAKMRFLMNKHKATRTCLKTLGVMPQLRRSGLAAALTHLTYLHSAQLGYTQTLMCLMHRSNESHRFGGDIATPFRSYALYEDTR